MKKTANTLICASFWCILLIFSALFWIFPDAEFSQIENRALTALPTMDTGSLLDGSYTADLGAYYADQFPWRSLWIQGKAFCELALGKGENNGILLGSDGQLARVLYSMRREDGLTVQNSDIYSKSHLQEAAGKLARALEDAEIPMRILLPPRPIEIHADAFSYPDQRGKALDQCLSEILLPTDAYIHLTPDFRKRQQSGENVYYRTDHHWTTLGAYYAYAEILRSFGMEKEVIPIDAFQREKVTADFCGSVWSASGMTWIPGEEMEIWYRGNEADFAVLADGRDIGGFYRREYLAGKDKYAVFLDGTHDIVTIQRADGTVRPKLLIFKDSFANSVAPFLAQHFDLVLCNLSSARTNFTNITERIREYDADYALILYSVGNMVATDRMNHVNTGA